MYLAFFDTLDPKSGNKACIVFNNHQAYLLQPPPALLLLSLSLWMSYRRVDVGVVVSHDVS